MRPDPATDFGARVNRRLLDEPVAFLTLIGRNIAAGATGSSGTAVRR